MALFDLNHIPLLALKSINALATLEIRDDFFKRVILP